MALIAVYALGKADKFLDAFLESAGQEAYGKWKARNAAETCVEADKMLEESGRVVVGPVPGRLIIPILEGAAQNDDPDMRKMWAALLANTASTNAEGQLPGFSDILRQLTPAHAKVLQWLYDQGHDSGMGFPTWPAIERKRLQTDFDLNGRDYAILMADMARLQLVERHRPHKDLDGKYSEKDQIKHLILELNDRERFDHVTPTTFGIHFMMACTPPRKA